MIVVKEIGIEAIDDLVPLFEGYRKFYKAAANPDAAKQFLSDRINKEESIIFIAYIDEQAVGFTQLYPSYSSVSMQRLWILNDLFVDPVHRGKKVGEALLRVGKDYTKRTKAKSLILETANDNPAQKLYEREGWIKDEEYLHYIWKN